MTRTKGKVSVGKPIGAKKLANPAWQMTVRIPASNASNAVPIDGVRNTQPTAVMVKTGLNAYNPISISVLSAPSNTGTATPKMCIRDRPIRRDERIHTRVARGEIPLMLLIHKVKWGAVGN